MSSLAAEFPALMTWGEFQKLPNLEDAQHYELHDGVVVIAPPPRPIHLRVAIRIAALLREIVGSEGVAERELPYRPAADLQFWVFPDRHIHVAAIFAGTRY